MKRILVSLLVVLLLFGGTTVGLAEEPVSGGELRIACNRTVSAVALAPGYADSTTCAQIQHAFADTLVRYNTEQDEFLPCLATEWECSEDGLTWTFKIREGVHFQKGEFQDGRLMTAEDVAWCINWTHAESWAGFLPLLDKAEVIDEYTVALHLTAQNPNLLNDLTASRGIIVPREELEGWGVDNFSAHAIGTGAFQVVEHIPDQYTRLVKNENYWGDEPYLDGVTFYIIKDDAQALNALQAGEVDIIYSLSGTNIQSVANNKDLVLTQIPTNQIAYMGMNMTNEILSDNRVREAIAMAINREEIVAGVYANGDGVLNPLPLSLNSWGYDESLKEYVPPYDPEAAKALLAEAGYPDGFDIVLTTGTSETDVRAATIIQYQLAEIGVNCEIQSLSTTEQTERFVNNTMELFIKSQNGTAHPNGHIGNFLSSGKLRTNYNAWAYSDPETDAMIAEALAISDSDREASKEIYHELVKIALEENIGVFYANNVAFWGVSPRVHGYEMQVSTDLRIVGLPGQNINIWLSE